MISKEYFILSPEGIHARPATALVKLVRQFQSAVHLKKGDTVVRLNSLLNILSLGAKGGDRISILVEGDDEERASRAIDLFFTEQLKNL
jgi:phosphotransferase system HPr (HPr) family protein